MIAPLINIPLNLIAALPKVVPNKRNADSNFGPLSVKNLITEFIFLLFLGSLMYLTNAIRNFPVTIEINAPIIF